MIAHIHRHAFYQNNVVTHSFQLLGPESCRIGLIHYLERWSRRPLSCIWFSLSI